MTRKTSPTIKTARYFDVEGRGPVVLRIGKEALYVDKLNTIVNVEVLAQRKSKHNFISSNSEYSVMLRSFSPRFLFLQRISKSGFVARRSLVLQAPGFPLLRYKFLL